MGKKPQGYNFKRLQSALLPLSHSQEWHDLFAEWEFLEVYNAQGMKCACTHDITECNTLRNRVTEKTVVVGSCCIKRFMPDRLVKAHTRGKKIAQGRCVCDFCYRAHVNGRLFHFTCAHKHNVLTNPEFIPGKPWNEQKQAWEAKEAEAQNKFKEKIEKKKCTARSDEWNYLQELSYRPIGFGKKHPEKTPRELIFQDPQYTYWVLGKKDATGRLQTLQKVLLYLAKLARENSNGAT